MCDTIELLLHHYNTISNFAEDFEDLGFEIIDFGEDFEHYEGGRASSRMLLKEINTGKMYAIEKYVYRGVVGDAEKRHVYEVVPKVIEQIIYVKK